MSTLRPPLRDYRDRDAFRCCILETSFRLLLFVPSVRLFLRRLDARRPPFFFSFDGEFPSDNAPLVGWPCRCFPAALA